ncbi:MAG: ComEA family DNA-binding protein [Oscillospiraceae bacterium]
MSFLNKLFYGVSIIVIVIIFFIIVIINKSTIIYNEPIVTYNDQVFIIKTFNINTATKSDLMKIDGIGEKLADEIIRYKNNTPFLSIEDIKNVKGIKDKLFKKIKSYIYV